MDFDVIPYKDIQGDWKKLGAGSFGNVYKGTYLGIDVAIKEVLPSKEYDVDKYFEREWRLMKEARHPNVVLYLGLSKAPHPDNRIFIVSEFIDHGNLRVFIHDKTKPFPWRLRISFATDIARALAYLHARNCIHRDLKGENLLLTSNGRLKITDFGFARIAPLPNSEESKRLTFCGTDSYMSPEILLGDEFDLSTDLFSLGVIFCEILSRKLADERVFKRSAPDFGIDPKEVRSLASPGCPAGLIDLALACCSLRPADRPSMLTVLEQLRNIELEVLGRASEDDLHVGSLKFLTPGKRPNPAPRIPSFGMGIGSSIRVSKVEKELSRSSSSESDSDEELAKAMGRVDATLSPQEEKSSSSWIPAVGSSTVGTVKLGHIPGESEANQPLLDDSPAVPGSPSVLSENTATIIIRPKETPNSAAPPHARSQSDVSSNASTVITAFPSPPSNVPPTTDSIMSIESFHTATSSIISVAAATEGGSVLSTSTLEGRPSSVTPIMMPHRFTLIKPGAKRSSMSGTSQSDGLSTGTGWGPFDFFFFSSGLGLGSKCDLCSKRLGWKPVLECDDCGFRAHIRCGEVAPRNCGTRPGGTRGGNVPLNQLSPSSSKGKLTKMK